MTREILSVVAGLIVHIFISVTDMPIAQNRVADTRNQ